MSRLMDNVVPSQRRTYPLDAQDHGLIDEALMVLPEIGKCLYQAVARHPRVQGLSLPQIKTLGFLVNRAPCTVGELANGLGVSMPTASEAVDRLAERDLVSRTPNPADRRQFLIDLTDQARDLMAEAGEVQRRQLREAFGRLAPDDRPRFMNALTVLAGVLREWHEYWPDDETRSNVKERGELVASAGTD